jgi:Arc/MetJ-type ribon-helix-helix transcriptional regulator
VKRRRQSRSNVVRDALARLEAAEQADARAEDGPYEDWADVIGIVRLGARTPERTTWQQLTRLLQERHPARRPR